MPRPTDEQNFSYGQCLRLDALRSAERGQGRSGYLSDEMEALHQFHGAIVAKALDAGVEFDRASFEVVA